MKVETIDDLLVWIAQYHHRLDNCLHDSLPKIKSERARLLVPYLRKHEQELESLVSGFRLQAPDKVRETWCTEFYNKSEIASLENCVAIYAGMDSDRIAADVIRRHDQLMDLLSFLIHRPTTDEVIELLQQVLSVEQHEAQRIAQSYNRFVDI